MPEKVRLERDRAAQRVCRRQVRAAAAPGPQQGGPCVERDSLLNATGSEFAVQCTARRRARRHSDGVQRYTFTGGEVSTFEDEESIKVSLCGNATPLWQLADHRLHDFVCCFVR